MSQLCRRCQALIAPTGHDARWVDNTGRLNCPDGVWAHQPPAQDVVERPYRILVTGWRDWPENCAHVIETALDVESFNVIWPGGRPIVVVHGDCPYGGVDLYATRWAEKTHNAQAEAHPAERDSAGKLLGPARNSVMVAANIDVCLGFPGPSSRGTWDCLRKAVSADIPTRVVGWCSAWQTHWTAS